MKALLLFIFSISTARAFTLNNNFAASFSSKKVKVFIAGNTTCANAETTVYELLDYVSPAIDDFWNKVPSTSLRLASGGFTDPINNINSGKLCSPTDTACVSAAGGNLIPPVDGIVIGCNDRADNFGGANVIAVTIPNKFSGKKIKGALILINNSTGSSAFKNMSQADRISVISHEIGHAIGLGHSEDSASLMYYKTVDLRRTLGQDDVDGVSFLYPVHVDGCGLFGGTTTAAGPRPGSGTPLLQLGLGFLLIVLLGQLKGLLNRPKACSPA